MATKTIRECGDGVGQISGGSGKMDTRACLGNWNSEKVWGRMMSEGWSSAVDIFAA